MQIFLRGTNSKDLSMFGFCWFLGEFWFSATWKLLSLLSNRLFLIVSVGVCAGSRCLAWAPGPTHTSAPSPTLWTPCLRSSGGSASSAWGRGMSCAARRSRSGPGLRRSSRWAAFTLSQLWLGETNKHLMLIWFSLACCRFSVSLWLEFPWYSV